MTAPADETRFDPRLRDPALKAKGRRPYFHDDPAVDKVLAVAMALAAELSVTRERLDTVERLLAEKGLLSAAEIDAWRPDDAAKQERAVLRSDFVRRVLRIVQQDLDEIEQARDEGAYTRLVSELAEG
jgi:hypothetical protein